MFKKNYVSLNPRDIVGYKGNCYNILDEILSSKKYYQNTIVINQNIKNDIDIKIVKIIARIKELLKAITEMNNKIATLEVDIYTCKYNYDKLSNNRENYFNDFKQEKIIENEYKVINSYIENNLEKYKKEYRDLIVKFKKLTEKKHYLMKNLKEYKNEKKELVKTRKNCFKKIEHAKKNIEICNCNIEHVNETLENIDMIFFSGKDCALERQVKPKIKRMKKITE